jgi:hypothetical protein
MIPNATTYHPTPEQTDAVSAFLSAFEREDFVPSKVQAPPGKFPDHAFVDKLSQFHQAVYDNGFVFSFDWPACQEEARRYYEQPELLGTADLQVLRKLITLHVRKERFCEGHLSAVVKSGYMAALLRRLKELREASSYSER